MTSRLPITLVDSNCWRLESSSEYGGHFVGRPFFIGKLFLFFIFKNDEALVAEEMRRTTEAAAVSEDTMFEEPASDDGQ